MRRIDGLSSTKLISAITGTAIVLYISACGKPTESERSKSALPSITGQRIDFNESGHSEQYRTSGWSKSEEKFTWSEGKSAKLSLPVGTDRGPWILKVTMAGLVHGADLPAQPVEVYANNERIADWQVGNPAEFAATIPESVNKPGGKLEVEFRIPKATSPKSLGENEDARVLGICVYAIELISDAKSNS